MPNHRPPSGTSPVFLRLTAPARKRFRMAAVEEDKTYAELVESMLDARDARLRKVAAAQKHPGHIPRADAAVS